MVTLNIPVERIQAEAAELEPAKAALWLLAAPFLLLGWTARALWLVLGWIVRKVWLVLSLGVAAVKVGWESGPVGKPAAARGLRR